MKVGGGVRSGGGGVFVGSGGAKTGVLATSSSVPTDEVNPSSTRDSALRGFQLRGNHQQVALSQIRDNT